MGGPPAASVPTPDSRDAQDTLKAAASSISEIEFERLLNLWDETRLPQDEDRKLHSAWREARRNGYKRQGDRRPASHSFAACAPQRESDREGTPQISGSTRESSPDQFNSGFRADSPGEERQAG